MKNMLQKAKHVLVATLILMVVHFFYLLNLMLALLMCIITINQQWFFQLNG